MSLLSSCAQSRSQGAHSYRDFSGSGSRLIAVELTGSGGYDPGGIARRAERILAQSEWQGLSALLAKLRFWSLPSRLAKPLGADGSQWIIEGIRHNSQYHVVDRWTPEEGTFRDAGLLFLTLSGVSVPDHERY